MVQTLSGQRELLQASHDRLRVIAEGLGAIDVLDEVAAAQRRLTEATFRLVVLGEYKRGKSTLINALLGEPILPMGVVPLTSVVTELRYRAEPGVAIEFLDGLVREITPSELPEYVTEPGNPRNQRRVRRAVVHHAAPLLRDGAIVVDTPGVGSVFEHNSDTTYQLLAEADAVVIVLAADQPLSSEELELLKALRGVTERILFVVNRVDVLAATETEASVRFIREMLATLEGQSPERVFPLSARLSLEARTRPGLGPDAFLKFEHELHEVLIARKADILLERSRTLTLGAADLLALRLTTERRAMQLTGEQLKAAVATVRGAAAQVHEQLEQSGLILRHQLERIHEAELRREGATLRARLVEELWPRVECALDARPGVPLHRQVADLSAEIGQWVVDALRRYYLDTEVMVDRSLSRAVKEYVARVQTAVGDIIGQANQLLSMQAGIPSVTAPISERPHFYLRDWDFSGGHLLGHNWALRLPRRWSGPRARSLLRQLLERRIDQNLAAIRYDWATRLDDAARRFGVSSRDQLATIVRMVSQALDRAKKLEASSETAFRVEALDRALDEAASIRAGILAECPQQPDQAHAR